MVSAVGKSAGERRFGISGVLEDPREWRDAILNAGTSDFDERNNVKSPSTGSPPE